MLIPYIGITDFISLQQVWNMHNIFERQGPRRRKLHIGVMMSYKTLYGIPTKWKDSFPPKECIAKIFSSDDTYNCLHYADYHYDRDLAWSVATAISYGGIGIHALQLDMVWPNPGEIANAVHTSRKNIEVILQVGRKALDEVQNDPQLLVEKLRDYEGVIHRVLLDKSGGEGRGMDAVALLPFARAIKKHMPLLGLVVAGGLGPTSMHLVEPIVKEFPDVSIDAQGKLRPSGNAIDPIDWNMAGTYLVKALELLK